MLQQRMKEKQNHINQINEEIKKNKSDLTKLKNENTHRREKIDWIKEKIKKLERENRALRTQDQSLSYRGGTTVIQPSQQERGTTVVDPKQQQQQQQQKQQEEDKTQDKVSQGIDELQMLDFFNTYLDNQNKQLDRYSSFKKKEEINDFINPYPVINIKPTIENIPIANSASFRLDEFTDFRMLKDLAFHYWNLGHYLMDDQTTERDAKDMLELTDENFAHIELNEKVIEFFSARGQQNFQQITILLQKKKKNRDALNNLQVESVKISGGNKNLQQSNSLLAFIVKKARIQKVDIYKNFFAKFPGLRYYISELQIAKESAELENKVKPQEPEFELDDMNCLILSILIVILALTLISYNSYLSTSTTYYSFKFMKNLLDVREGEAFSRIYQAEHFYSYMDLQVARTCFNSDSKINLIRVNFELIGAIQLRIQRVEIKNCTKAVNQWQEIASCFDNNSPLTDDYKDWKYQTDYELGITDFPQGNLTKFSGGGYVEEFSRDMTQEAFKERVNGLRKQRFIDQTTSRIFVNFLFYSPNSNCWILGELYLERDAFNFLNPYPAAIEAFIPNIYYGEEGEKRFENDIVRLIFACLLLSFVAYRIVKIGRLSIKNAFKYVFLEVGLFNTGVGVFSVMSVATALKQSLKARDLSELVNIEHYVNLAEEAALYKEAEIYVSATLMFIFLRLSYVLKLNERIAILFLTFSKGFKELFAFLAIQFPLFFGFVISFQIIYGHSFYQYASFTRAVGAQIALIQGQFNVEEFMEAGSVLSLVVILIYYFFMLFFIISLFQAILIECYRNVIMKIGYPQDKEANWNLADFFGWFFSWTQLFKTKESDIKQQEENQQKQPLLQDQGGEQGGDPKKSQQTLNQQ